MRHILLILVLMSVCGSSYAQSNGRYNSLQKAQETPKEVEHLIIGKFNPDEDVLSDEWVNLKTLNILEIEETDSEKKIDLSPLQKSPFLYKVKLARIGNKVPNSLLNLTQVKELIINDSGLDTLPDLSPLISLKILVLDENQLQYLSDMTLPRLEILRVRQNKLTKIPSTLFQSKSLRYLDLSQNPLHELPEITTKNEVLSVLKLQGTYLKTFPQMLTKLMGLHTLDISYNPIVSIPSYLILNQRLKKMNVDKTLLTSSQVASLQQGMEGCVISFSPESKPLIYREKVMWYKNPLLHKTLEISKDKSKVENLHAYENLEELIIRGEGILENLDKVVELKKLKKLTITETGRSQLPEKFSQLKQLEVLNLSANTFEGNIPSVIFSLPRLKVLDLSNNQIQDLTGNWKKLEVLRVLDLSENKLTGESIGHHLVGNQLERLNLAGNSLKNISKVLIDKASIHYLNLSSNELKTIPNTLNELGALEHLDISQNKISATELEDVKGIDTLKMSYQFYTMSEALAMPEKERGEVLAIDFADDLDGLDKLKYFSQLEALRIQSPLKLLPKVVRGLTELRELSVNVEVLPKWLPKLKHLNRVQIEGIPMEVISPILTELRALEYLDLSKCGITEIPPSIANLAKLKKLTINYRKLEKIASEFSEDNLPDLEIRPRFTFAKRDGIWQQHKEEYFPTKSNISSITMALKNPLKVKSIILNFSEEDTTGLDKLRAFVNLELLVLLKRPNDDDAPQISQLPKEMATLKKLKRLFVTDQKLRVFPNEILELPNLELLGLGGNSITTLPQDLIKLKKLKGIYLEENPIHTLPSGLAQMPALKEFVLKDRFKQLHTLDETIKAQMRRPRGMIRKRGIEMQYRFKSFEKGKEKPLKTSYLKIEGNIDQKMNLGAFKNLKGLYIKGNGAAQLPANIIELDQLQILVIAEMTETKLDHKLTQLPIRLLGLRNKSWKKIPSIIYEMNINGLSFRNEKLLGDLPQLLEKTPLEQLQCEISTIEQLEQLPWNALGKLKALSINASGEINSLVDFYVEIYCPEVYWRR